MYEEQIPLDEKTTKLLGALKEERSKIYNRLNELDIESRNLNIRNNQIYQEIRNLTLPKPIIVTEEQRVRYAEELASDNWKKYSCSKRNY